MRLIILICIIFILILSLGSAIYFNFYNKPRTNTTEYDLKYGSYAGIGLSILALGWLYNKNKVKPKKVVSYQIMVEEGSLTQKQQKQRKKDLINYDLYFRG